MAFDRSEVSKCMLCLDPPCNKACPQHADIGNIINSLYFRNYIGAVKRLDCDCTYCNAPCEKACVLSDAKLPVDIREIFIQVKKDAPILIGSKCVGCHLCRLVCSGKAIRTARKVVRK